jgi:16S rRNA (adenine1518-N6/adenine1519-N6)-dimethyltransferase
MSSLHASRRERLMARLEELGGNGPKRSLGQNFLVSDLVVDRILFAVRTEAFPAIVEVGPGLGALTEDLLLLQKPLTAVELDRRFAEYWTTRSQAAQAAPDSAQVPNGPARVIEADALQLDWSTLALPQGTLFVSNLPYQISSSILIERSIEPAGVTRMILMFQKEVAQRIAARAATKEYGFLTVIAQAFWETQTVCEAGPRDFFPPPNVASRVLQFKRRKLDWLANGGGNSEGLLQLAKAAFSHRRKLMLRNLEGSYFNGNREIVPRLEAVFATCGLDPRTTRAEELDPEAFVRLYLTLEREGLKRYGK